MTSKQEVLKPVDTKLYSNGLTSVGAVSEEALYALNLQPHRTACALESGRPIYDRLPAESQEYKKGYDSDQAYVYINPKNNLAIGKNTLQVVRDSTKPSILFVNDGEITWKKGQLIVDTLTIDVSTLNFNKGLDDGAYQFGYILGEADPTVSSLVPGYARATLKDSVLGDVALDFESSSDSQYYESFQAISENSLSNNKGWRPVSTSEAGTYNNGSWYVLDFQAEVLAEEFTLSTDLPNPSASLAIYYSDDAIIWEKTAEVKPTNTGWQSSIQKVGRHRYWRFYFWDGLVSVSEIRYTGEAYVPDKRVSATSVTATPYLDGLYEEIAGDYIQLASFEVKQRRIGSIQDLRNVTNIKYEPVADWLTDFQDSSLKCLFNLVENYSTQCLNPTTANYHFYNELDGNTCSGDGQFLLGPESDSDIDFPYLVEFSCTDGSTAPCGVLPKQVLQVAYPEVDSDLANKAYTDFTLNDFSLDNGLYN